MWKNSLLLLVVWLVSMRVAAQDNIFELNKQLGRGVNMGNMFEAPNEGEWSNPFKDDYFQRIAGLGFNHVRIPIRWDTPARTLQTAPYTINRTFLERIKSVIDKALAEKLYVVINMHHHEEIFQTPDPVKPRFLSQWAQISEYFKNYDNRLVFEVMNEPNTQLTSEKWNVFFADALAEIRKVSKTRAVLMGTANWGGLGGVPELKIPKDPYLILTVHYYDPFNFTHQGAEWVGADAEKWLGTKWENTNLERDEIAGQFQYLINFAKQNNLPVHVGEFGAYSKADLESRVKWTNFLARWFEQQGFSWAYWEFSAGFGIYNPATNQYIQPLVDALLKNPLPPAVVLTVTKIFESKFDGSDTGWNLYLQSQAKATYVRNNGTATIDVTQASAEGWHAQFVKNDIPLKKGSRYLVSFEASATADAGITQYIGKNAAPYNAYSGYKGFTLSKDFQPFSYSFVMTEPDDPKARIVFDLGRSVTKIAIKNLVIQEVIPPAPLLASNPLSSTEVVAYPNPGSESVTVRGLARFTELVLTDLTGREQLKVDLRGENQRDILLKHLPTGHYFIRVASPTEKVSLKMSKQ